MALSPNQNGNKSTSKSETDEINKPSIREKLHALTSPENHSKNFEKVIFMIVLVQTALIIFEFLIFYHSIDIGKDLSIWFMNNLHFFHLGILIIFTIEMGIKIYANGIDFFKYPKKPEISAGNWYDFIIISASVIMVIYIVFFSTYDLSLEPHYNYNGNNESSKDPTPAQFASVVLILRFFRLLRILRLVSVSSRFEYVLSTLFTAAPTFAYIGMLLGVLFLVYALAGNMFFEQDDKENWGTLPQSIISLFKILTLEQWIEISGEKATDEGTSSMMTPQRFLFAASFIIIGNFIVLSMIIATLTKRSEDEATKDPELKLMELVRGYDKIEKNVWEQFKFDFKESENKDIRKQIQQSKALPQLEVLRLVLKLSNQFTTMEEVKQNEILELLKPQRFGKNHQFNVMFGFMLGSKFSALRPKIQDKILEKAQVNKSFSKGFSDYVGNHFKNFEPKIQNKIIRNANESTPFQKFLVNGIGRQSFEPENANESKLS